MIEFILRILITLILADLESLGSPQPAEPPTESAPVDSGASDATEAIPIGRDNDPAAAAFPTLRTVDPCGLHDVAAAARVTGHRPDQIMPTESLAACQLRLHAAPLEPSWTFTTHVGVTYGTAQRRAATHEEVDGHRVYRDESTYPHARTCTYTRPFGTDHGISLTVSAPLGEPTVRPCPLARAYLHAARSLTRLVLRLENGTEPQFSLGSVDPCEATLDILRKLGISGVVHPDAPYRCRIQPEDPAAGTHRDTSITIDFGLTADPRDLAGAGTGHQAVTVADHTGTAVAVGPEPRRCELVLTHDTAVAISLSDTTFMQTITIKAESCDQAKSVAAAVLQTIATH